jgi:hypothetical protein
MNQQEKFERCIVCGGKLNIKKIVPIQQRKYYIEGTGQLCRNCYLDIYFKSDKNDYKRSSR